MVLLIVVVVVTAREGGGGRRRKKTWQENRRNEQKKKCYAFDDRIDHQTFVKGISGVLVRLTTCKRLTCSLPKLSLITLVYYNNQSIWWLLGVLIMLMFGECFQTSSGTKTMFHAEHTTQYKASDRQTTQVSSSSGPRSSKQCYTVRETLEVYTYTVIPNLLPAILTLYYKTLTSRL